MRIYKNYNICLHTCTHIMYPKIRKTIIITKKDFDKLSNKSICDFLFQ